MAPTLIEQGAKMMLKNRTERMLHLLELDAPDLILCEEAAMIFKAACSLSPELAGAAMAKSLRERHAREKQICLNCFDAQIHADMTEICDECNEQIRAEQEENDDGYGDVDN
jgi:hypothetical protein